MSEDGTQPPGEDFEDFFENALCGNMILDPQGRILRSNRRIAEWLAYEPAELVGRRFSELLTIGGKILHETHLAPLLRMQGYIDEVSVELLSRTGKRMKVMVNALERRDEEGELLFIRLTAFKATQRHVYEQNLRTSKAIAEDSLLSERETAALREQFVAVLGHDLRNPLGAITMGVAILARAQLTPRETSLLGVMEQSARRMNELIGDVMDFARFRLGGGVSLQRRPVDLEPVIRHVVEELATANPGRSIHTEIELSQEVNCDPARLSQILSNLLANALAHGAQDQAVRVRGSTGAGRFELSIDNHGEPMPLEVLGVLFQPFTREGTRASQNGLGLGLYIASEVAKAHGGELTASSTKELTTFTFQMPLAGEVGPG